MPSYISTDLLLKCIEEIRAIKPKTNIINGPNYISAISSFPEKMYDHNKNIDVEYINHCEIWEIVIKDDLTDKDIIYAVIKGKYRIEGYKSGDWYDCEYIAFDKTIDGAKHIAKNSL